MKPPEGSRYDRGIVVSGRRLRPDDHGGIGLAVIARLTLVAGVLSILAGCGAAATSNSTVATPTPTATATPAPTPDVLTNAAAAYLAAANTINTASDAIYKTCKTFTSLAQGKACWSRYEAVSRAFLTTIFAIAYPPSMKADVDAQITDETKVVSDEATLAANPNDNAAFAAERTDGSAETAAANIVRHDLGLPQVTVPTP
jgi:hypothetical protein